MPEYTEEQIVSLKRNAAQETLDKLIKAAGVDSEDSLLKRIAAGGEATQAFAKLKSLESQLAKTELSKNMLAASHKHGFKDPQYAEYLFSEKLAKANDEEKKTLAPDTFLETLKASDDYKHHFYAGRKSPANSGGSNPTPDPKDDDSTKTKSARDMTPDELAAHITSLGFNPSI